MFEKLIETLTLDKTCIRFKDIAGIDILDTEPIYEYAVKLETSNSPFLPQYSLKGYLSTIDYGKEVIFFLSDTGPNILYITIALKSEIAKPGSRYRLPEVEWVTYWEDTKYGYLFQITNP